MLWFSRLNSDYGILYGYDLDGGWPNSRSYCITSCSRYILTREIGKLRRNEGPAALADTAVVAAGKGLSPRAVGFSDETNERKSVMLARVQLLFYNLFFFFFTFSEVRDI